LGLDVNWQVEDTHLILVLTASIALGEASFVSLAGTLKDSAGELFRQARARLSNGDVRRERDAHRKTAQ